MQPRYGVYLKDELTDSIIYKKMAAALPAGENRAIIEKLAAQEQAHYDFWRQLAPQLNVRPNAWGILLMLCMRRILGVTFTVKFLELHEKDVVKEYRIILPQIPEAHRARLQQIIADEESHEESLMAQIKEKRIDYIGFIALGLADAIIEITGVHAGFLGVTGSTLVAGISGIVVGFAAAISMGSAAYLQAKQEKNAAPLVSGFATYFSYLGSVVLLALPYFFLREMYAAFAISTSVGILLIAGFTSFGVVVFDRKFWREFLETALLMLGTAVATYLLGTVLGKVFHIDVAKF